jgi:hypothetical protein
LLVDGVGHLAADHDAFVEHHLAQRLAQIGRLGDRLGDDVARAVERLLRRVDALLGVDERRGQRFERQLARDLRPEVIGQRFEALLARDGRLRAALRLVGQVEIFELALVERLLDARFQFVGELALLGDGGENRLAPVGEFAEVAELLFDVADLDLVEIARGFLAVTGDKRHGAALVEQLDHGHQAAHRHVQRLGDVNQDFGSERLAIRHGQPAPIVAPAHVFVSVALSLAMM